LATALADTCIKGGLSLNTTGTAGCGVINCNINIVITTTKAPIVVFLLIIRFLLFKPHISPYEFL